MSRSDRIIKQHADRLAKLSTEQRETVLNETARLLERLSQMTQPPEIPVNDDDSLLAWLRSQPKGSRITRIHRKDQ